MEAGRPQPIRDQGPEEWRGEMDGHPRRSGLRLELDLARLCRGLCAGRRKGEVRLRFCRRVGQGDECGSF